MAKKKKGRKKKPSRGVKADQRRRERLEARRREKAEAEARQRRTERIARIRRRTVYAAALVLVVWFFFFRTTAPSVIQGELDDYDVLSFSESGVNVHTANPVWEPEQHGVNPPTSGPHAATAAPCGVHSEPPPDENLVHSFEHGAVGIFYDPALDLDDIRSIEAIVGEFDYETLSAPYQCMESRIAVTSWAKKMELGRLDEEAIRNYIDAFRAKGPEPGAQCPNTANRPFEPPPEAEEGGREEEVEEDEAEGEGGAGGAVCDRAPCRSPGPERHARPPRRARGTKLRNRASGMAHHHLREMDQRERMGPRLLRDPPQHER